MNSTWFKLAHPKDIFSVDLRSLALSRVIIGFILIYDLYSRLWDLEAFYTDFGLLPRGTFLEKFANSWHVSLYFMSGEKPWLLLLMGVALISAIAMLLGYRTRIATIISWILLVSLHNRNPIILNGGDVLLRMCLFWCMFLPLGARFSIDAAMNSSPPEKENRWFGMAGIAIIGQVFALYFCTAWLKSGKEWWPEGTASYYALSLEQFTTNFGLFLSQFHEFLRISTYGVFALEYAAPFLLICPFLFGFTRTATVLALVGMHMGFELTMRIGLFPYVDMALLVALLPSHFWEFLKAKLKVPAAEDLTIYYDGECGFCKKMALLLKTFLILPNTPLNTCQATPETREALERENSWIVIDKEGSHHYRYDGILTVLNHSPLFGIVTRRLPLFSLAAIGDWGYNLVATNRNRIGPLFARVFPYREEKSVKPWLLTNLVVTFFIGFVGLWNVKTIDVGVDVHKNWKPIAYVLRLDQKWNMFAPYPLKNDGWFVVEGTLKNGDPVDVWREEMHEADWKKPELVSAMYPNARWRKYMMNIWNKSKKKYRLYYGKYLCRSWNRDKKYKEKLAKFTINYLRERTFPPGRPPEIKKFTIWRHDCFKSD